MKYSDYTALLSPARMSKYIRACNGNKAKAISLYHYNIKLSERMFAVINMFEIILRNTIDKHYRAYFSDPDWLVNQVFVKYFYVNTATGEKSGEMLALATYSED